MSNYSLSTLAFQNLTSLIYMSIILKIDFFSKVIIFEPFFFYQLLKIVINIMSITIEEYSNINIRNLMYGEVVYHPNSNNLP